MATSNNNSIQADCFYYCFCGQTKKSLISIFCLIFSNIFTVGMFFITYQAGKKTNKQTKKKETKSTGLLPNCVLAISCWRCIDKKNLILLCFYSYHLQFQNVQIRSHQLIVLVENMLFIVAFSIALSDIHYFALPVVAGKIIYIQAHGFIRTSVCLKQVLFRNR